MSEQKFDEMIYAYSAGCLDKEDLLEFLDYSNSGGKLAERKLGELQNLTSLLPLILEIEMPHPQVRDKFARRLFRLRDEVRVKAKANQRNPKINIPVEAPKPVEQVPEEIKKEEPKIVEVKKEEIKKEEPKKEEFKKPEPKIEENKVNTFAKKPEPVNVKPVIVEKKEPVKEPEPKKEEKKQVKPEFVKEEKKIVPEKEPVKIKEPVQQKPAAKIDYDIEEEEEKKGFPKFVIIGVIGVILIGLIYFLTRGGSGNQATNQKPVDSTAIKAKQEQIQKLNEQLASIQNSNPAEGTAANKEQTKVDDLNKELQALKEELAKINQAKAQQQTAQPTTQQQQAPATTQQQQTPAVVQQQPVNQPVAAAPKSAQVSNNDNAPTAASEVRKTEEAPQYVTYAEEMPTPVGGMPNMLRKVNVPERAINAGIEGRVFVKAYIDESGNVIRTSVARGLGYGCDEVAEFVVKNTKFVPGKNKGKAVRVEMTIPVPFKL